MTKEEILVLRLKDVLNRCASCETCKLHSIDDCPNTAVVREAVALLERQLNLLNRCKIPFPENAAEKAEKLYGYRIEDLARIAILMENCDVKPEDIKRLTDNLIMLYGVVMRGIKKEVKASADRVLIECRYPGYVDVVRMIEEEKNEKRK